MLQILAHTHLTHQLVLVSIHPRQLSDMRKRILERISQLKGIHIPESILHIRIHNQLGQSQNLTTQMKSISETRLFAFLCRESFDGFEVEVVVEMEVV